MNLYTYIIEEHPLIRKYSFIFIFNTGKMNHVPLNQSNTNLSDFIVAELTLIEILCLASSIRRQRKSRQILKKI